MKEDALKHLLESVLGKSKSARGGEEAVFKCPSCNHHKKKFQVNLQNQHWHCWVCNAGGRKIIPLFNPSACFSPADSATALHIAHWPKVSADTTKRRRVIIRKLRLLPFM